MHACSRCNGTAMHGTLLTLSDGSNWHTACLVAKLSDLRAQVTQLQEHNTKEVERRRAAESGLFQMQEAAKHATDRAIQAETVGVGRPLLLVLEELRRAKLKYPHFADDLDQALDVLDKERDELVAAVLKEDINGEHGIIREAAQVATVAIRIIEMALAMQTAEASA